MNHENVLKVADRIANLPYEEKIDSWGEPKFFNMASSFGSACCVAGWTGEDIRQWVCARWVDAHNDAGIEYGPGPGSLQATGLWPHGS